MRRAVVLIGPRRVGKTVMLKHLIQRLLDEGCAGTTILFVSLDTPLYSGHSLESMVRLFVDTHQHPPEQPLWVLFDEVQYLKDWEVHLKSLVDTFPRIRFVASGSAAAALRMKSRESGAGRFTEFVLPPLTFAEYLDFAGSEAALIPIPVKRMSMASSWSSFRSRCIATRSRAICCDSPHEPCAVLRGLTFLIGQAVCRYNQTASSEADTAGVRRMGDRLPDLLPRRQCGHYGLSPLLLWRSISRARSRMIRSATSLSRIACLVRSSPAK